MRGRCLSIAIFASLLLAPAPRALASPPTGERVQLDYASTGGCDDAASFAARVDRLTPGIAWTDSAAEALRIYGVRIAQGAGPEGGYDGVLGGATPEGAPLVREVHGASCQEVETALAFILAVELAPQRSAAARADVPAPLTRNGDETPERGASRAGVPHPSSPVQRSRVEARWLSPAVDLGGRTGLGTTLAPLVEVGAVAQIASDDHRGWGRGHLRTSVAFAAGAPVTRNGASITLSLWTLRFEGCFPRAALRRGLLVFPCASLESGVLLARGEGADGGRARPGAWLAPGASGRVSWEVSRVLHLGSELGAFFPLVRDSFYYGRRDRAAVDVSSWGARLTFGATLLFP